MEAESCIVLTTELQTEVRAKHISPIHPPLRFGIHHLPSMENLSSSFLKLTSNFPSYAMFSQVFLQRFGIDIGQLVSIYLVIHAFYRVAQCNYHWLCGFVL